MFSASDILCPADSFVAVTNIPLYPRPMFFCITVDEAEVVIQSVQILHNPLKKSSTAIHIEAASPLNQRCMMINAV